MKKLMKKAVLIFTISAVLATLLFPTAVYATNIKDPGPDWNIKIEFRYTKGQESKVNIPNNITRFGRDYHLIDKTSPILEKTLEAKRVYTYHIDGFLTDEQIKEYELTEGVSLTPVEVAVSKVVDKTDVLEGLPNNDVEYLPFTKAFQIATKNGLTEEALACAAVTYTVQTYDDWNLPKYYKAEIVYRGLETVMEAGYYEVKSSYNTEEDLDGVPQYVIIATYAPDQEPTVYAGTGGGLAGAGGTGDDDTGLEAAPISPPIDQGDTSYLDDPEVPLTNTGGDKAAAKPSVFSSIWPLLLAIGLAGLCAFLLYKENKRKKERAARKEEKKKASLRARGLTEFE